MDAAPLRPIFEAFTDIVHDTYATWTIWCRLFWSNDTRPHWCGEILERAAPEVFRRVHNAMIGRVVLNLVKLDDPDKIGQHENLNLNRVLNESPFPQGTNRQLAMKARQTFKDNIPPLRTIRHKLLGHNDKATLLDPTAGRAKLEPVACAVKCLCTFHFRVEKLLEGTFTYQTPQISEKILYPYPDEVDSLVALLKRGLDASI